MSNGYSLHIGVNSVDPDHYAGWNGELVACEYDAKDMEKVAKSYGYSTKRLLTEKATREGVISSIRKVSKRLKAGDIFFLSFSGHGGRVKDIGGDEPDFKDETWCLFDGQLIDDELCNLFSEFGADTRIFVLSDSCHSGSVVRDMDDDDLEEDSSTDEDLRYRFMPRKAAGLTYRKNQDFYDSLQLNLDSAPSEVTASVRLISACQDDEVSVDGDINGRFTAALLFVWNNGKFSGNYNAFYNAIASKMPSDQTPNHYCIGNPDKAFEQQHPFQI